MTTVGDRATEWLEADGLGGFASSTTAGVNTRRYHALLLCATNPPGDRQVLVNDAAVWLETPNGVRCLSQHVYVPDVVTEFSATRTGFEMAPWPRFTCAVDGVTVVREVTALHGLPLVVTAFRFSRPLPGYRLCVRPLLSGRDFHALHHENPVCDQRATIDGELVAWKPYGSVTGVLSVANASFRAAPEWYRNTLYERERDRGLDCVEDLSSPGVLEFDLADPGASWILAADTAESRAFLSRRGASVIAADVRVREAERRARFPNKLELAGDAYLVKRGDGKTIIAGYPWFGDWGRDTFIALRGLCFATNRLAEARDILLAWMPFVSLGMLPNRFPDRANEAPEYNSVDAALWYVLCVGELLANADFAAEDAARARLVAAVRAVVEGHLAGTRHGIRVDRDGLLAAGELGVQLTWMDAKIGDYVVTPRIGKPVEIQALWLNAVAVAERLTNDYGVLLRRGAASFEERFYNPKTGCLFDVIDVDHEAGKNDPSIRPNQIFAVGGLPLTLLPDACCREVLAVVERELWTPVGLRSLEPHHPSYVGQYRDGVYARDTAYHQGTVWPWLAGAFIEAWVKCRGNTPEAKREARLRFLASLASLVERAGIGHVAEVADGDAPHTPGGCYFQAWSVGELLRVERVVLADGQSPAR